MKIRWCAFNLFLLMAIFLIGCKTPEEKREAHLASRKKKEMSTLRLHLETANGLDTQAVPILRSSPVMVKVESDSFLDERDVVAASIKELIGGFVIQVEFNAHGKLVLDVTSASSRGRRVAIMSDFGEKRWLAAPTLSRHITDGILVFTPDATLEEAERIVNGLNNVAAKLKREESLLPISW